MKNKKIFISDLDGTLLNTDHNISDLTKKAIQTVINNGDIFIIASGRITNEFKYIFEKIGQTLYAVSCNGAYTTDTNLKIIQQQNLKSEIAHDLLTIRDNHHKDVLFNAYNNGNWYVEKYNEEVMHYQKHSNFSPTVFNKVQDLQNVNKVYFLDLHNNLDMINLEAKIKEKYADNVYITFSTPICLEVMDKKVNKANGINHLLNTLGDATLSDAYTFGDGMNDLEMLIGAKKGFVMKNADSRLLASLNGQNNIQLLDLTNNDDAVAKTILSFYE